MLKRNDLTKKNTQKEKNRRNKGVLLREELDAEMD